MFLSRWHRFFSEESIAEKYVVRFQPCAQKEKAAEELRKAVTYVSTESPVMVLVSEDDDADLSVCFFISIIQAT